MACKHSNLVKSHFEEEYKEYDELIRKLIPKYEEMHKKAVDLIHFKKDQPLKILDLGVGTGQTALTLLRKFPKAKIYGIDLSPNMMEQSKIRLKDYLSRVSLEELDMINLKELKNKYDVCIAVLSIHHLNETQKPELFKKIFTLLKKGGIFSIGDLVKFDTEKETKQKEQEWKKFLIKNLGKKEGQYWYDNYLEEDLPSSISNQLKWLKEAGFKEYGCPFKHMNYVVIYGKK